MDSYLQPSAKGRTQTINGFLVGAIKKTLNQSNTPFLAISEAKVDEIRKAIQEDALAEQEAALTGETPAYEGFPPTSDDVSQLADSREIC